MAMLISELRFTIVYLDLSDYYLILVFNHYGF